MRISFRPGLTTALYWVSGRDTESRIARARSKSSLPRASGSESVFSMPAYRSHTSLPPVAAPIRGSLVTISASGGVPEGRLTLALKGVVAPGKCSKTKARAPWPSGPAGATMWYRSASGVFWSMLRWTAARGSLARAV